MKILVLNGGSSSDKISLYEVGKDLPAYSPAPLWESKMEWRDHRRADALEQLILQLSHTIDVVGHRIVHGGSEYEEPVRITPAVKAGIAAASAFAPLHNQGARRRRRFFMRRAGGASLGCVRVAASWYAACAAERKPPITLWRNSASAAGAGSTAGGGSSDGTAPRM